METESYSKPIQEQRDLFSLPITSECTMRRCVNLDWMEVHCREPLTYPLDAAYYRAKGYIVHERSYGTRVYRQMFTIEGTDGEELLEVRRDPASQGLHGIHDANECHIRLKNRTCYFDDAAESLANFLRTHAYTDIRISRVDICLDFVKFDPGDDPQAFIRRYMRHKYAKINQGRLAAYGEDTWTSKEFNSLSWGSKSSPVSTKLYNKTMELYDPVTKTFAKPYIREAWLKCGLVDDYQQCTKDGQLVTVWRLEFSIRSAVKNWVPIEIDGKEKNYQSLRNTLECYFGRDRILVLFASLAEHYFRFKKYRKTKRKDRCPDKVLFRWSKSELTYRVGRPSSALGSGKSLHDNYNRLIGKLRAYQESHTMPEIYKACEVLISAMTEENLRSDLASPWSHEELSLLRHMMRVRSTDPTLDYAAAMAEVKKLLSITDRTISIF